MEDVEYVLVVEDEDVRRIYSFPVVSFMMASAQPLSLQPALLIVSDVNALMVIMTMVR